jgi:hypothetical protein
MLSRNNHRPSKKAIKPPSSEAMKFAAAAIQNGKIAPAATLMRGVGNNTTTANESDSVKIIGPRGPKSSNQVRIF